MLALWTQPLLGQGRYAEILGKGDKIVSVEEVVSEVQYLMTEK